ncbi:hypothetical protein AVEN_201862-1 [Araneus ventricosus]|uniref:Uncharacterized protein n=1 Tax=Araneus ventricosus TaxID=182803 RepID=A0A4Y2KQ40_ARAVE|nr:hypothetical protein AVEN_201862-1 [Araneus ventricosus]
MNSHPREVIYLPCFSVSNANRALRKAINETLNLPERASNNYLYGHRKFGSFALPILAEECELNLIDSAFKLLTSKDEKIPSMAFEYISSTVKSVGYSNKVGRPLKRNRISLVNSLRSRKYGEIRS